MTAYTESQSISSEPFTIQHDIPFGTRLVPGGMLALMGSFFLYYLVTGLIEYIRFATAQEWLASIPGFIVNLIIVLIFAIPAWVILLMQPFVVIDEARGEITAVRDWRLFQTKHHYKIADVTAITITEQVQSSKTRTSFSYPVHLQFANDKLVLLQSTSTEQEAHLYAAKLSQRLQVPLHEQYHLAP